MKKKIVTGLALVGIVVFGSYNVSSIAKAQSPTNETSEQKIARLEKEVRQLREQIAQMKRATPIYTMPVTLLQNRPSVRATPGVPFEFNGQTYYRMPLTRGDVPSAEPLDTDPVTVYRTPDILTPSPTKP